MNRIGLALLMLSLIQPIVAAPQLRGGPRTHNGFLKEREYLDLGPDGQRAYAMGLLDGFYSAPLFGAPENHKVLIKIATYHRKIRKRAS